MYKQLKEIKKVLTNGEISRFKRRNLKKSSSLLQIDPFLGENRIPRVGGRMKRSCFDKECKHPVLLLKKGKVMRIKRAYVLQTS